MQKLQKLHTGTRRKAVFCIVARNMSAVTVSS